MHTRMHARTVSQILVNRQIHFHTKSASISEALKATRAAMIWSHACYFLTVSNKQMRCLSASLVLWSQQAQSTSVPNWAKSIRFQFVIFSWEWASNNSSRKSKINIANEIRHLMFSSGGTLISTLRRRWCLASTARGWQTVWIGSTNTSSVVLLPKIIWHLYLGLTGTAAQYTITQRMCAPESVHQSNSFKSITSGSTNFLTKHEFGSVSCSKRRVWFIADELTQIFSVKKKNKKKKTWQHFSSVSTSSLKDFFQVKRHNWIVK